MKIYVSYDSKRVSPELAEHVLRAVGAPTILTAHPTYAPAKWPLPIEEVHPE